MFNAISKVYTIFQMRPTQQQTMLLNAEWNVLAILAKGKCFHVYTCTLEMWYDDVRDKTDRIHPNKIIQKNKCQRK
jgi:hypothetical protein